MKKNFYIYYNFKFLTKPAFSLLEMLVVIGIVGILVSIGFVSYSTAQKKARDAKRKQDLKAIQNSFEQYYSICNFKYPNSVPNGGSQLIATTVDCPNLSQNVIIFTMPKDPLGGDYSCNGTCDITQYSICSPKVNGIYRLETQNCTNENECCINNQQ